MVFVNHVYPRLMSTEYFASRVSMEYLNTEHGVPDQGEVRTEYLTRVSTECLTRVRTECLIRVSTECLTMVSTECLTRVSTEYLTRAPRKDGESFVLVLRSACSTQTATRRSGHVGSPAAMAGPTTASAADTTTFFASTAMAGGGRTLRVAAI